MLGIMVILVLLVAAFDWLVFGNLDRIAHYLDKSRLAVTEAVFGVLLAALAVELVLRGLSDLGVIELVGHWNPATRHRAGGGRRVGGVGMNDSYERVAQVDGDRAAQLADAKALRVHLDPDAHRHRGWRRHLRGPPDHCRHGALG